MIAAKMKRIIGVLLIMSMIICIIPVYGASGDIVFSIKPSKSRVNRGDVISANVELSFDLAGPLTMGNLSVFIKYNQNLFEEVTEDDITLDPPADKNDLRGLGLRKSLDTEGGESIIRIVSTQTNNIDIVTNEDLEDLGNFKFYQPLVIAKINFRVKNNVPYNAYEKAIKFIDYMLIKYEGDDTVIINTKASDANITVSESTTGGGPVGPSGGGQPSSPSPSPSVSPSPTPSATPTPTPTPTPTAVGAEMFTDIAGVPWAREAIDALVKAGIINGTTPTTFEPDRNITRAEFCKLVVATFGVEAVDASMSFKDVPQSQWYYDFVMKAAKAGVVNGYPGGIFMPDASITREEMAAMMVRAFNAAGVGVPDGQMTFADSADMGDWAVGYIASLAKMGIVNGRGDNKFEPKGTLTRAEAAKVLYLAYIIIKIK